VIIQIVNVKIVNVKTVTVRKESKMIRKLFLVLTLLFTFSCEDNIVEEESSMKLWLNGEEIDVEAEYKRITTYGEEVEYFNDGDSTTYIKKIFIIL